jgi:hypothetical protein
MPIDEARKATDETPTQKIRGMTMEWQLIFKRLEDVAADIKDIRKALDCIDEKQNSFILTYTKAHEELTARVVLQEKGATTNGVRIDKIEAAMEALKSSVTPLILMSKVLMTVGTFFLVSLMGLIWAILTHSVEIMPK